MTDQSCVVNQIVDGNLVTSHPKPQPSELSFFQPDGHYLLVVFDIGMRANSTRPSLAFLKPHVSSDPINNQVSKAKKRTPSLSHTSGTSHNSVCCTPQHW